MTQRPTIKVGIIQLRCHQEPEKNIASAIEKIEEAAGKGAQIVCLPELFRSLYFCNTEDYSNFALAEPVPGPTTDLFSQLAAAHGIVIVASLFEKRAEGLYHNTTVVIDANGNYLGKYRKMHIPDDPGFYEKFYFTPGDLGYKVFQTRYAKIGVLICWDQWYPEAARITSLMGAEILFYPTAIGWALSQDEETNRQQYDAWQTIQRAHAIANGVHVISVNRTGGEDQLQFWGGSFASSPFGAITYQSPYTAEEVAVIDVDLSQSDYYRTHWPFLRDRRIDTYNTITSRYLDEVK